MLEELLGKRLRIAGDRCYLCEVWIIYETYERRIICFPRGQNGFTELIIKYRTADDLALRVVETMMPG